MSDHQTAIWHIVHTASRARRQDLLAALVARSGWVVQAGPFAGMRLPDRPAWGDGDLLPKLLGCYELELQDIVADIVANVPDLVINIGAAEGYYAVGLARLLPGAFIHAFDSAPEAQDICRTAGTLNDVGARLSVAGTCTVELLGALLPRGRSPLIVSDCAGAEVQLLDPARLPTLRTATLIVECHDYVDPAITNRLVERLNPTHELTGVTEGGRNPHDSEFLQRLDSLDRWLAVCEFRPTMMHWLIARPRHA